MSENDGENIRMDSPLFHIESFVRMKGCAEDLLIIDDLVNNEKLGDEEKTRAIEAVLSKYFQG